MFYILTGSFLKGPVHLIHIIISVPSYLHFSGLKVNVWRKDHFWVVLTGSVRQLIMISILCFKIKKKSKISSHQKGQKGWAVPRVPSPSEFITHSSPSIPSPPYRSVWIAERRYGGWWQKDSWKGGGEEQRRRACPILNALWVPGLLVFNVSFHLHRHCEVSFMVFLIL